MSADEERILIQRLAAGELDAVEEERARTLIARDPELAALLDGLRDLHARTRAAFPEPPPARQSRAFVQLLQSLTPGAPTTRRPAEYRTMARSRLVDVLGDADETRVLGRPPGERGMRGLVRRTFRRPEPVGAHLFHLREVPREAGLSVELELYAGDVLALHSEVLLVSAFAGSYMPTRGSVFGAIAERFGISFERGAPPGAIRHPGGLLHFRGIACPAFDSLWVLEMRDGGEKFSREDLRSALDAIGRALPDMLTDGSSLTLPLLGTGHQRIEPTHVAREILSALPRWAASPRLRTVRVVTHDLEHVAILNRALDDRDFAVANSALDMACRELRRRVERGEWSEPVRAVLKDLLAIASARYPSLSSIALEGRRVAESVMQVLVRDETAQPVLFADREGTQPLGTGSIAPYLQLLLAQGRAVAEGRTIDSNDAVMVLYAAMRAADVTAD